MTNDDVFSAFLALPCINPKLPFQRDTTLFSSHPSGQLRRRYMSSCKSNPPRRPGPSNRATSGQEFPCCGWRERAASDISGARTDAIPSLSIYRLARRTTLPPCDSCCSWPATTSRPPLSCPTRLAAASASSPRRRPLSESDEHGALPRRLLLAGRRAAPGPLLLDFLP